MNYLPKGADGGKVPMYKAVCGILTGKQMTSQELVEACAKEGIKTDTRKIGVMLATYKKLFRHCGDKKWELVKQGIKVKAAAQQTIDKAARADLIRSLVAKHSKPSSAIPVESMGTSPRLDDVPEYRQAVREVSDE